jgi:hypothetical protein
MIDKDKVVEAAKAYVEKQDVIYKHGGCSYRGSDEYFALKKALNPPPPRPTEEECVKELEFYIQRFPASFYKNSEAYISLLNTIIHHLKEPSLQWVKNTGEEPEYQLIIIKDDCGGVAMYSKRDSFNWTPVSSDKHAVVKEYIILE